MMVMMMMTTLMLRSKISFWSSFPDDKILQQPNAKCFTIYLYLYLLLTKCLPAVLNSNCHTFISFIFQLLPLSWNQHLNEWQTKSSHTTKRRTNLNKNCKSKCFICSNVFEQKHSHTIKRELIWARFARTSIFLNKYFWTNCKGKCFIWTRSASIPNCC